MVKRFVLVIPMVYAVVILVVFPKWTVDDAYITYRYAQNFVKAGQLTWNIGEAAVEGYTGVVLPTLLTMWNTIGIPIELASKGIGIVSFLVGGFVLWRLLSKYRVNPIVTTVVLMLYFSAPMLFTHSLSGLETMLFVLAVLLSFLLLETRYAALALLFVSLVRPEGLVLAIVGIAVVLVIKRQKSLLISLVIPFALPYSAYFIWRLNYYGYLLPNTFYVKTYHGWINPDSVIALFDFGEIYLAVPIAAMIVLFIFTRKRLSLDATLMTGLLFAILTTGFYIRTNLEMNYSHRFFVPLFVTALFLTGVATSTLSSNLKISNLRFFVLIMVLLATLQSYTYFANLVKEFNYTSSYYQLIQDEHLQVGRKLKQIIPPDQWLAVHIDAGAIPYTSQLKTVDLGGLNDATLTHGKPTQSERVDYLFSFHPAAIVFTSYEWDNLEHGSEANAITTDVRFTSYRLVYKFRSENNMPYYQFVYLRDDIAR